MADTEPCGPYCGSGYCAPNCQHSKKSDVIPEPSVMPPPTTEPCGPYCGNGYCASNCQHSKKSDVIPGPPEHIPMNNPNPHNPNHPHPPHQYPHPPGYVEHSTIPNPGFQPIKPY